MGMYGFDTQRTAAAAETVGSVAASSGTAVRRGELCELILGSQDTPNDNAFLYTVRRFTAAGTSTSVTPVAYDAADPAFLGVVGENHTVEPTYSGVPLISIALNQRSTFRWVGGEGGRPIYPATNVNGLGLATPTAAAVLVTASWGVLER